jgi:hypothetical protein
MYRGLVILHHQMIKSSWALVYPLLLLMFSGNDDVNDDGFPWPSPLPPN